MEDSREEGSTKEESLARTWRKGGRGGKGGREGGREGECL